MYARNVVVKIFIGLKTSKISVKGVLGLGIEPSVTLAKNSENSNIQM